MLKRLAAVAAFAVVPVLARAGGLEPGTWQLSGSTGAGFTSSTVDPDGGEAANERRLSMRLDGLYYVTPVVGVGVAAQYAWAKTTVGGSTTKSSTMIVGPALGLDVPVAERASLFATGSLGLGLMDVDDDIPTDGWGFLATGGVRYFVSPSISIDALAQYQLFQWSRTDSVTGIEHRLDVDAFTLGFGVSVYLR